MKWISKQLFRLALWYINKHIVHQQHVRGTYTSVNVPFEPGTSTSSYSWTYDEGWQCCNGKDR